MRLALALVLVAGCAKETVTRPPRPPVDWASLQPRAAHPTKPTLTATDKERAAAKAYLEAVATGDPHKLDVVLDDEAHFRFAGGKDVRGQTLVEKALLDLFGPFDQRQFAISRVLITNNAQSLEWVMRGVHRATQKPVTFAGATLLWTKDDGSIADIHLYVDEAMIAAQLGLGPDELRRVPPPTMPTATQTVEQTGSDAEQRAAETVRDALHALEENREGEYLAAFADDVVVSTAESSEPMRGTAAVRAWFQTMRASIGYLAASMENRWGIGDYVVVEYQLVGEQRKPIGWVPMQKKEPLVKLAIVDVVQMRDGKIARIWRFDDPLQLVSAAKEQP